MHIVALAGLHRMWRARRFTIMALFFDGIPGFGQLSSRAWNFFVIAAVVDGNDVPSRSYDEAYLQGGPSNESLQLTSGRFFRLILQ